MAIDQKIFVAADAVIFRVADNALQVALIKRKNEPYKGQWALPGGFVENDEDLHDAALRELKEETGLHLKQLKQLQTFGKPDRDPRFRNISVAYWGTADAANSELEGADDALEAAWHDTAELPATGFDHKDIIAIALQHYHKEKTNYR